MSLLGSENHPFQSNPLCAKFERVAGRHIDDSEVKRLIERALRMRVFVFPIKNNQIMYFDSYPHEWRGKNN